METLVIQVKNPVALWREIRELIAVHYGVTEETSFMKQYPEVYHIYLELRTQSKQVRQEAERRSGS